MSVLRKVCLTLAAAAVSVGLLGITAPAADADSSWGSRTPPAGAP
jgi:hypothetical protein